MKNMLLTVFVILIGCNKKSPKEQYIDYINESKHHIKQHLKKGEVLITVKYLPSEYLKLMHTNRGLNTFQIDDLSLCLDIKLDKVKGIKLPKDKTLYLDFDMQKDFMLVAGQDSLLPVICQKVENGISESFQYLLVFSKPQTHPIVTDFSLVYNDKIFGTGQTSFVYKQKDILKIPQFKGETTNEVFN